MPQHRAWIPCLALVLVATPQASRALGTATEVLRLDDNRLYVKAQFDLGSFAEPNCDEDHWHKAGGASVTAIDGTTRTDPDPTGCGFGKVSEIPESTIDLVDTDTTLTANETVAAGSRVTVPAGVTLTVPLGRTLTLAGRLDVSGTLFIDGGTVDVPGSLFAFDAGLVSLCPSGPCSVGGVLNISGGFFNHGEVVNLGTIDVAEGGALLNAPPSWLGLGFGGLIDNRGLIIVDGSLRNGRGAILGNDVVGTITNSDDTIDNFGSFTNDGTIDNAAGTINNRCNGTFVNNGSLTGNPVNNLACACDDGQDNDGDGLYDWDGAGMGAADPGCLDAQGTTESPACSDGDDDDGDGGVDHDGGATASQGGALCVGAGDPFGCCTGPTAGCAGPPDTQCVGLPAKESEACGDGEVAADEACDDGNVVAGDCCDPLCQPEDGQGSPSCCDNGLCQVGDPCGVVCFGSPAACALGGAGGTQCLCAVAPSPSCGSCSDPARTLFVGEAGTQACGTYHGNQALCEQAWLCSGSGSPASCWYDSGLCLGCGPNNENAGLCTNTCTP